MVLSLLKGQNQKRRLLALEAVVAQATGEASSSLPAFQSQSQSPSQLTPPATDHELDPEMHQSPLSARIAPQWTLDSSWEENLSPTEFLSDTARPVLHVAVCTGRNSIVQFLLEHGADITNKDIQGYTALHLAVEKGYTDLVDLLIQKSADPNDTDNLGRTSLFMAIRGGNENEKIVKILLDACADVNHQDSVGYTALHLAVEQGLESMMQLLIENGANVNA